MLFLYTGWLTYTCLYQWKVLINESPLARSLAVKYKIRHAKPHYQDTLIVSRTVRSNVTDTGNNQLILPNATATGTNRSVLGFSEFSDAELAGFRLRCGIWITFVIASTFVAAAKFYFGYRVSGYCVYIIFYSSIMNSFFIWNVFTRLVEKWYSWIYLTWTEFA